MPSRFDGIDDDIFVSLKLKKALHESVRCLCVHGCYGSKMKWINSDYQLPIKSWCAEVEEGALQQAADLANHPCVYRHVAIMPDCHCGYGMPIGGVIATVDAVIPNAVGVDIGCGVRAVRTTTEACSQHQVEQIVEKLKRLIPVGFAHHNTAQRWEGFDAAPAVPVVQQQLSSARKQLGTLGGGNHFIEIQVGDDGRIWLMLHSGSRNFGYRIAKEYNGKAQAFCTRWHPAIGPFKGDDGLAFLPLESSESGQYVKAMQFALEFARANRAAMMARFQEVVHDALDCSFDEPIDIHHNYAAVERHFGKDVWVHRKGATSAKKGELGIVPGSMGTASYIVRGLGNRESFESCSHGAGRNSGRAEYSRTHTVRECNAAMAGIVFGGWGTDRKGRPDVSEAPGAYKDIDEVISAELDLIDVVVGLRPLGVIKG